MLALPPVPLLLVAAVAGLLIRRHRRTGTLWEGRFKSCLVDSDRYFLTVCRYIELNPVRAAMVAAPEGHQKGVNQKGVRFIYP